MAQTKLSYKDLEVLEVETVRQRAYWLSARVLFAFLSMMCFFTTSRTYLVQIQDGGSPWKTGDWLINFEGGLIRRGLIGELIMQTSNITGLGVLKIVLALQIGLLFIFLGLFNLLLWTQNLDVMTMASLFSPAFILFYILDPQGSLRKEIIGFILLLLCSNVSPNTKKTKSFLFVLNAIYFIFIFSWEAGIIFLLPVLYFLYLNLPSVQKRNSVERKLYFTLIMQSVLIIIVSPFFRGTMAQVGEICSSLTIKGINSKICNGAISNLSLSFQDSYRELSKLYQTQNYGNYFVLMFFTMVPLVYALAQKKKLRVLFVLSPSLLLFIIAWDYGRWVNIIFTATMIFILYFQKNDPPKLGGVLERMLALVYFVTSFFWGMHHYGYPYIDSFFTVYLK